MLSNLEYKLIIVLFGITLLLCTIRTSYFVIDIYNESVASAELERRRIALGEDKISFSICYPCDVRPHEFILPGQILILSIAFLFFVIRHAASLLFASIMFGIILFGYFDWARLTREVVLSSESYSLQNTTSSSYYLYNASYLDYSLLFLTAILLLTFSAILIRFTAQKVYARLDTNDQTPGP